MQEAGYLVVDTPIPYGLLPSLELRDFMNLEAEDPWAIAFSLEGDGSSVGAFAETFCRDIRFLAPSSSPITLTVTPRSSVDRATLRRDQIGVNKEEQVGEGGAEVCSVDGPVSGGFWRVNVLAPTAVELDGLFVRDVCEADWKQRLG